MFGILALRDLHPPASLCSEEVFATKIENRFRFQGNGIDAIRSDAQYGAEPRDGFSVCVHNVAANAIIDSRFARPSRSAEQSISTKRSA